MSVTIEILREAVIAGDEQLVIEQTEALVGIKSEAAAILQDGLIGAMAVVGERMKSGKAFIPEVLMSAQAMKAGLEVLKPHLSADELGRAGTVVLGTVEGDLHDIGKNIVSMMLESAGFTVVDLGKDVPVARFVEAVKTNNATLLGMSALLTTTMVHMADVVATLKQEGLRDSVRVMVGGGPVTPEFAMEIGADAAGNSAIEAVERARELVCMA